MDLNTQTQTAPQSTASAIAEPYDLSRLQGKLVTLTPYVHGYSSRDMLYQLWVLIEQEKVWNLIFYDTQESETPVPTRGDLGTFAVYMATPGRLPLIVQDNKSGEISGLMWYDSIIPKFRAQGSYWMRRRFWGHRTREAALIALDYGFHYLNLKTVWAFTPWLTSVKTTNSLGFTYVASIPDYCLTDGKIRDIHVSYLKREDFKRGQLQ